MRSITTKLILAFIAVSVSSIALVMLFTRWRNNEEFRTFLFDQNRPSIVTSLSNYYTSHGSWDGITDTQFQVQPPIPRPEPNAHPFTLVDTNGQVVYAGSGYQVGNAVTNSQLTNAISIQANGKQVGFLLISRSNFPVSGPGSSYLDRINRQIILSGVIAILLALILAIILSRTLTRPIRELTTATQIVSEGNLAQQVPVRSRDELGQLATSFNRMNADLARSLNLRRQMTADIAHELRTPISIILGHAEAVHDGILPASTETFEIIRDETQRLEHLVEDLRTLSMADAGELKLSLRLYPPQKLLEDAQKVFSHQAAQKKISFQSNIAPDLPEINVDPERIKEVLSNIIQNALRHTPENGQVALSAKRADDVVKFRIQDSGPGINNEDIDRIFERFYRTESSRSRDDGGSGLGLAIAKSIIEKHNGRISAESKPGDGLAIIITLPISKE